MRIINRRHPEISICISLAGTTVFELSKKVRMAKEFNPGFIEIRLDYLDPDFLTKSTWTERISEILKQLDWRKTRAILTLRSRREGGRFYSSESERIAQLEKCLLEAEPRIIDLEIDLLVRRPRLLDLAVENGGKTQFIASSHSFSSKTPNSFEIESVIRKVPRDSNLFATKIVRRATRFEDNLTLLSLYGTQRKRKLIAFCTGSLGVYSRIACLFLGSPLSYTSLPGEAVAPGQLDAPTMLRALRVTSLVDQA